MTALGKLAASDTRMFGVYGYIRVDVVSGEMGFNVASEIIALT